MVKSTSTTVRELRKVLRYSQRELAEEIGVHRVTVARWESGQQMPLGFFAKVIERLKLYAESRPPD